MDLSGHTELFSNTFWSCSAKAASLLQRDGAFTNGNSEARIEPRVVYPTGEVWSFPRLDFLPPLRSVPNSHEHPTRGKLQPDCTELPQLRHPPTRFCIYAQNSYFIICCKRRVVQPRSCLAKI